MSFFEKRVRTFEIHRKSIDMKAWVKDKFKNGKHLFLVNYPELENDRFTLIRRGRISLFYTTFVSTYFHFAEIKGKINETELIYIIRMSMPVELGLWIAGLILMIFSIGLIEEGNYTLLIILWGVFLFMIIVSYFLVEYEIKHLEKLLEEEMRFI